MAQTMSVRWKTRFFTIWAGQAFSLFGSQLVQFALIWWLTETTRSATVLAMATLVGVLPQVLMGPFIGPLVDRWNRKTVMMTADSLVALTTAVLALLFATGTAQIWHVYLVMFIRSAAGSFHFPSMQASTSLIVPEERLSQVAGLNQMLQGLMSIVAPPAGALLIGVLPIQGVLMIDIGTALVAVLALFVVHIPQPQLPTSTSNSFWREMGDGLRYIRGWAGLMIVIAISMLLNLLIAPPASLAPLLVTNHFDGQADQLAILNSAMGIGIVVGGLVLGIWGGFKRRVITSLLAVIGMAGGFFLTGLAPANAFWLGVVGFFVAGFMMPIANGPMLALLQTVVAPEMQGRVFTLLMSGSALMMPISLAVAGPLADRIGIQTTYWLAGLACALLGMVSFFIPALINIEKNQITTVPPTGVPTFVDG